MRVLRALSSLLVTVTLIGCTSQSTAPGPAVLRDTAPPWPAPRDGLAQIQAAGLEPDVRMNPILLKPSSDVGSQVIVNGEVRG